MSTIKNNRKKGWNWRNSFTAVPIDNAGNILPSTNEAQDVYEETLIYWPVIGVITNVYYCNDFRNRSLIARQGTNSPYVNSTIRRITVDGETKEIVDQSNPFSFEAGPHFECDVSLLKGFGLDTVNLRNVPVCNAFGGIQNFGFITPQGTTNTDVNHIGGRFDGDQVVVQFIGGDKSRPVITGFYPHAFNSADGPRDYPTQGEAEDGAFFRVNGTEMSVSNNGDITIDASNAGDKRTINTVDGALEIFPPDRSAPDEDDNLPGTIVVQNNSNIIVSAGDDTAIGDILLQSRTEATLKSRSSTVEVKTDVSSNKVNLQVNHGGSRPAARKFDRVRITNEGDNDLFAYINNLNSLLKSFSTVLSQSVDPFVVAAADLLDLGLGAVAVPTYAEGEIIEGSEYVHIGGPSDADDALTDTSGFVQNELLGAIDYSDPAAVNAAIIDTLKDCCVSAVTTYAAEKIFGPLEILKEKTISTITITAKSVEEYLKVAFPPTAIPFKILSNKLIGSLLSGSVSSSDVSDLTAVAESINSIEQDTQDAGGFFAGVSGEPFIVTFSAGFNVSEKTYYHDAARIDEEKAQQIKVINFKNQQSPTLPLMNSEANAARVYIRALYGDTGVVDIAVPTISLTDPPYSLGSITSSLTQLQDKFKGLVDGLKSAVEGYDLSNNESLNRAVEVVTAASETATAIAAATPGEVATNVYTAVNAITHGAAEKAIKDCFNETLGIET